MKINPLHKNNKLVFGLIIGILTPFIAYGVVYLFYKLLDLTILKDTMGSAGNFRERTIALISIMSNAIPMHLFNKRYWDQAMRGLIFPTLIGVILWMYFYGFELLNF